MGHSDNGNGMDRAATALEVSTACMVAITTAYSTRVYRSIPFPVLHGVWSILEYYGVCMYHRAGTTVVSPWCHYRLISSAINALGTQHNGHAAVPVGSLSGHDRDTGGTFCSLHDCCTTVVSPWLPMRAVTISRCQTDVWFGINAQCIASVGTAMASVRPASSLIRPT